MSHKTTQCHLFADEAARKYLWQLMAERNTPLVNELLRLVTLHPDFPIWRSKGKLPTAEITKLAKTLKTDPCFNNQPAKFHQSAEKTVAYTLKSWLAIQKLTQRQLDGKSTWLRMLRTNAELIADSGQELEVIKQHAAAILLRYRSPEDSSKSKQALRKILFQTYDNTDNALTRSAIAYLFSHHCKISADSDEDTNKFLTYRRKVENQIKRLTQQLENRLPRGRDLTGERYLNVLELATNQIPADNEEASSWQAQLLKKQDLAPFPIILESNMDLRWFEPQANRIGLRIGGLSEHEFTIGCGQRQLHYFQRFFSDYQTVKASKSSSSLLILRSAKLIWIPKKGNGEPWNVYQLCLSCTLDTRLLTAEGTKLVIQDIVERTTKNLMLVQGKSDRTVGQDGWIKRLQSTLDKLEQQPFTRPSKPLYQGRSNIIVAVSMGLQSPVTATVVDVMNQKILGHRSTKQLLGDNYRLLNRQRNLQAQQRHLSYKAQSQDLPYQLSNSELGEHIDRLFAKAIIELAQSYHAGSIALPKLDQIRVSIQSEIDTKAQAKIPGYLEGQKKYAKQIRINLSNWSYGRVSDSVIGKAAQCQLAIEYGDQPPRASPIEQSKEIALSAYTKRVAL